MITFRETLEAALIVGIILAYLSKTKNSKYNKIVYLAILVGIIGSVVSAILFNALAGGFEGKAEEIFEGVAMLFGAFLLGTVIMWMMKQKNTGKKLKEKLSVHLEKSNKIGIFLLVFLSILREGVETVIFMSAANFASKENNLVSGILGIAFAILLGFLIFRTAAKINIKKFFNISTVLLLLFGAGLASHGIHELEEAGILPPLVEHVWDINPPAPFAEQGIYPLFHENGSIGSLAKGLFGYNGNPSLLELLSYLIYIIIFCLIYIYLNIEST